MPLFGFCLIGTNIALLSATPGSLNLINNIGSADTAFLFSPSTFFLNVLHPCCDSQVFSPIHSVPVYVCFMNSICKLMYHLTTLWQRSWKIERFNRSCEINKHFSQRLETQHVHILLRFLCLPGTNCAPLFGINLREINQHQWRQPYTRAHQPFQMF